MTTAELISRLGPTAKARKTASGWQCRCPAHDDRNPSLSIGTGQDGRILLKCFSGCSAEKIVGALGLTLADLMPERFDRTFRQRTNSETPETKRAYWPKFERPSAAELRWIGELRNVGQAGLNLAVERGLLHVADHRDARCWIVADLSRRVAQARRMDGQPFIYDGTEVKALTMPGSVASLPVGLSEAKEFPNILLVEGAPDLLAAFHFIAAESREADCTAVAMLGASQRIAESALTAFADKYVRLFPHVDRSGRIAAATWCRALRPHAKHVDAFDFSDCHRTDGALVKDLNDLTFIDPDEFEANRVLWNLCPA